MTPIASTATTPTAINEQSDFLSLWPHRWDYIVSGWPVPGDRPHWRTETRHTLTDRLIEQGSYLYGVRFGPETQYVMLDIDRQSPYHPANDKSAFNRLRWALAPLGLEDCLIVTSSESKGLHLYFPFPEAQPTWKVAAAVTALLENAGYWPELGKLEVFPNAKAYTSDGPPSLYNAHRLPMQRGSYILDEQELKPVTIPFANDKDEFARRWNHAQAHNSLESAQLDLILKQSRRVRHRVTARADKFLNDLNAEIELGWTGAGQTNNLLGKIALRSYVFGHVLYAPQPLTGEALAEDIAAVARSLPGFEDFCGHQDEIDQKAAEWARSVESCPRYYPYGSKQNEAPAEKLTWNERQEQGARERIRLALADLLEKGKLPAGAKARCDVLRGYGISPNTLYKHADLWHPDRLKPPQEGRLQPVCKSADSESLGSPQNGRLQPNPPNKLLGSDRAAPEKGHAALSSTQKQGESEGDFHRDSGVESESVPPDVEHLRRTVGAKVDEIRKRRVQERLERSRRRAVDGPTFANNDGDNNATLCPDDNKSVNSAETTASQRLQAGLGQDEQAQPVVLNNDKQVKTTDETVDVERLGDANNIDGPVVQNANDKPDLTSGDNATSGPVRCVRNESDRDKSVDFGKSVNLPEVTENKDSQPFLGQNNDKLVLSRNNNCKNANTDKNVNANVDVDHDGPNIRDNNAGPTDFEQLTLDASIDASLGDLAGVLGRISALRRQLKWDEKQVKDQLQRLFQKDRQALLSDAELLEWLQFLEFVVGGLGDE